jgi:quinol monooxygenase YgiN
MYVRVTAFEVEPSNLSTLADKIAKFAPIAKALPGVADIYVAWRRDGHGVVVAAYESEDAAKKAVARLQAVWGELAGVLKAPPRTDVFEHVEHVIG